MMSLAKFLRALPKILNKIVIPNTMSYCLYFIIEMIVKHASSIR